MSFWSGATLRSRLNGLIEPPDPDGVDCAAYALKVGAQYYVTPNDRSSDPQSQPLQSLDEGASFAIPPGQFAYVITEELVHVPTQALAFISIRARVKWKGLVNVSGFHVDPGFSGRLLFAVYNAGPVKILLRRGDPTFLIWFADLDEDTPADSKAGMKPVTKIDLDAINHVAGEIYSVQGLADEIRSTEKELAARITALERANGIISVLAGIAITILVGLAGQWLYKQIMPPAVQPQANSSVSPTVVITPMPKPSVSRPQPAPTQVTAPGG
uniref:dCTP deaminase domain-containing protein n=1 Tax=uncultured Sphingomonas sp. TaxID=158754 RepID=UPI0035CBF9AB